jgi:phosphate starvation-inducible protein PhoH and related proteins
MRGRTLNNAFIILDEAQNATSMQMKMFLTSMGANSTRHHHRRHHTDRPAVAAYQWSRRNPAFLMGVEGVGFVYFDKADVVRHRLVKNIIDAYERYHGEQELMISTGRTKSYRCAGCFSCSCSC